MAITFADAPNFKHMRWLIQDCAGAQVTKAFNLDNAITDDNAKALVQAFDWASNAIIVKGAFAGRAISGQKSLCSTTELNTINTGAVFTFQKASPLNAALTLTREYVLPAPIQDLFNSDNKTIIDGNAAGTNVEKAVASILDICAADLLAYIKAADTWVTGTVTPWVYQPSKSGRVGLGVNFFG